MSSESFLERQESLIQEAASHIHLAIANGVGSVATGAFGAYAVSTQSEVLGNWTPALVAADLLTSGWLAFRSGRHLAQAQCARGRAEVNASLPNLEDTIRQSIHSEIHRQEPEL